MALHIMLRALPQHLTAITENAERQPAYYLASYLPIILMSINIISLSHTKCRHVISPPFAGETIIGMSFDMSMRYNFSRGGDLMPPI